MYFELDEPSLSIENQVYRQKKRSLSSEKNPTYFEFSADSNFSKIKFFLPDR